MVCVVTYIVKNIVTTKTISDLSQSKFCSHVQLLLGNRAGTIRLFDVKETKTYREVLVKPDNPAKYVPNVFVYERLFGLSFKLVQLLLANRTGTVSQ